MTAEQQGRNPGDGGSPGEAGAGLTYRAAGVDIEAGYEAVRRIRQLARSTYRPEVLGDIGAFGGFFAVPAGYREPVLVAGADGVGTKLKIAFLADRHDTVGIDCVAYCVNDIICQGAEPLFFLDYLALGRLEPRKVEAIVAGVAEGCRRAGCALIGGETAEMPGFYAPGEYDLAGFAVGVVERTLVIDGSRVRPGDALVAIGSTGLQSSGFSLVRRALLERERPWSLDAHVPELGQTLGEALLTPTGIYARQLKALRERFDLRGVANISGGGLPENLPRALAPGTQAVIDRRSWEVPAIFRFVQREGGISDEEMFRTFNMGVAMVLVVPADQAEGCVAALQAMGEKAWQIGEVTAGDGGLVWAP